MAAEELPLQPTSAASDRPRGRRRRLISRVDDRAAVGRSYLVSDVRECVKEIAVCDAAAGEALVAAVERLSGLPPHPNLISYSGAKLVSCTAPRAGPASPAATGDSLVAAAIVAGVCTADTGENGEQTVFHTVHIHKREPSSPLLAPASAFVGTMNEKALRGIARAALEGLEAVWRCTAAAVGGGIGHGALHADNILVSSTGQVWLDDWGVATELLEATRFRCVRDAAKLPAERGGASGRSCRGNDVESRDVRALGLTLMHLAEGPAVRGHRLSLAPPRLRDPSQWSISMVEFTSLCVSSAQPMRKAEWTRLCRHGFLQAQGEARRRHGGPRRSRGTTATASEGGEANRATLGDAELAAALDHQAFAPRRVRRFEEEGAPGDELDSVEGEDLGDDGDLDDAPDEFLQLYDMGLTLRLPYLTLKPFVPEAFVDGVADEDEEGVCEPGTAFDGEKCDDGRRDTVGTEGAGLDGARSSSPPDIYEGKSGRVGVFPALRLSRAFHRAQAATLSEAEAARASTFEQQMSVILEQYSKR